MFCQNRTVQNIFLVWNVLFWQNIWNWCSLVPWPDHWWSFLITNDPMWIGIGVKDTLLHPLFLVIDHFVLFTENCPCHSYIFAIYKVKTLYKVYRKGHCSILSFHGKFSMAFLNHPHAHCILTYISRMIICPIDHLCPLELTFDVLRSVAEI